MTKKQNRLSRVLLLYRELIPSVRLCGHLQMEALHSKGLIDYRHKRISEIHNEDLCWADIVMLGRLDTPSELFIAKLFKRSGKYMIYILDDDLLNIPANLGSTRYYQTAEIQSSIRGMLALSNAILSPSPLLLKKYVANRQLGMLTEEPAVNMIEYCPHVVDAPVKIGFAGSMDRTDDLEAVLKDALTAIKAEYGDAVQLYFFGAIPSFAKALNAHTLPYTASYDDYRATLNDAQWDIGLAPMPDTPFHACKHYNKFCEYAAAAITGVFSTNGPYLRLQHEIGVGSFCSNKTSEWYQALKRLIDDPVLRERNRKEACDYAHAKLDTAYIANKLYCAHPEVFSYQAPLSRDVYPLKYVKFILLFGRIRTLASAYGWKLPFHVARKLVARPFEPLDKVVLKCSSVRKLIGKRTPKA